MLLLPDFNQNVHTSSNFGGKKFLNKLQKKKIHPASQEMSDAVGQA
jgi:hypothetical protein